MPDTQRRTAAFYAIAFTIGAVLVAHAAWVRDPALHVPPALGYVVAVVFGAAALAALAQAWGHPRAQAGFATLVLAGMSATGAWLATPAGARGCRSSLGMLPGLAPSFGCRTAFGAGAFVTALMTAYAFRQWWRAGSHDARVVAHGGGAAAAAHTTPTRG
jgi:hypothetical protein